MKRKRIDYEELRMTGEQVLAGELIKRLKELGQEGWVYCDDVSVTSNCIIILSREAE